MRHCCVSATEQRGVGSPLHLVRPRLPLPPGPESACVASPTAPSCPPAARPPTKVELALDDGHPGLDDLRLAAQEAALRRGATGNEQAGSTLRRGRGTGHRTVQRPSFAAQRLLYQPRCPSCQPPRLAVAKASARPCLPPAASHPANPPAALTAACAAGGGGGKRRQQTECSGSVLRDLPSQPDANQPASQACLPRSAGCAGTAAGRW